MSPSSSVIWEVPVFPGPSWTGRRLIDAFWQALGRQDLSKPKVLVYYGLGGIGKSRLRRELKERLKEADPQPAWAEVDFSLPSLRDPETALFSIRRELRDQHNLHFPTFDLVYAYLWKLSRPNAAPFEQGRPLFEAGTLASMLLAAAGMPLAIFVTHAAESGSKAVKSLVDQTRTGRSSGTGSSRTFGDIRALACLPR